MNRISLDGGYLVAVPKSRMIATIIRQDLSYTGRARSDV